MIDLEREWNWGETDPAKAARWQEILENAAPDTTFGLVLAAEIKEYLDDESPIPPEDRMIVIVERDA